MQVVKEDKCVSRGNTRPQGNTSCQDAIQARASGCQDAIQARKCTTTTALPLPRQASTGHHKLNPPTKRPEPGASTNRGRLYSTKQFDGEEDMTRSSRHTKTRCQGRLETQTSCDTDVLRHRRLETYQDPLRRRLGTPPI